MRSVGWISCLVICATLMWTNSSSAQFPPSNVQLNTDPTTFLQNEEQIWINWTDPLNVVADWRDWRLGFRRSGFAISTDGGVTWGTDTLGVGLHDRQSDSCLTGDRLGRYHMNMRDYEATWPASQITILRSTDKGLTWTGPVAPGASGPWFEDKQFTTVDRTGGTHDGNYHMSWTRFPNSGPAVIMFVRSTDGAQTFHPPLMVGPVVFSRCGTFSQGQGSISVVNSARRRISGACEAPMPALQATGRRDRLVWRYALSRSPEMSTWTTSSQQQTSFYLVTFIFKSGSHPKPQIEAGDVNCDGVVNSTDIIYLVNYISKGGPPPCNACDLI